MLRPTITGIGDTSSKQKVAAYKLDFNGGGFNFLSSAPNALIKPYISLVASRAVNYAIDSTCLVTFDQNFGPVRSLGFVYRPNFNAGQDYAEQGINLIEALPKVIVYNQGNGQTAHIETSQTPVVDVATAGVAGFYTANDLVVQGTFPFFANVSDTIEVCYVNPIGISLGLLQLNLYNFDVMPFVHSSFSNYIKAA